MYSVIIVEDEEIIRNGIIVSFDWINMNCNIIGSAKDGLEGLELIKELKPDIVITDIKMPKMSGIDMLFEAKKFHSFNSIILTSYAEFEYAKKAINLQTVDYLLKPLDEEELEAAILKIEEAKNNKEELIGNIILDFSDTSNDTYIKQIYDIIKARYNEKLTIVEVSEELSVSISYLSRKIKKELNTGFVDILNKYRIKKAIKLLKKESNLIYEIAEEVGFNDYKHFCYVFKKYLGISPSEYQKTICKT